MAFPLAHITNRAVSVVIPTFNHVCVPLVRRLAAQARACGLTADSFEIIVADDASTDAAVRRTNRAVAQCPGCRLVELPHNIGRSAIRNQLCREARHEYLLYLDSDVLPLRGDFLLSYLKEQDNADGVVCGGVALPESAAMARHNLRYRYESACLEKFSPAHRQEAPYRGFRSTNFMVRREVMEALPFDERVRRYGFEDVLWGKALAEHGVAVRHTDNPVLVDDFEPNDLFLDKTDEGLRTLSTIEGQMRGYSGLVALSDRLAQLRLRGAASGAFSLVRPLLRRTLCSGHPSVLLYNVYRAGRFMELRKSYRNHSRPKGKSGK